MSFARQAGEDRDPRCGRLLAGKAEIIPGDLDEDALGNVLESGEGNE
jgi:hypothetical protein